MSFRKRSAHNQALNSPNPIRALGTQAAELTHGVTTNIHYLQLGNPRFEEDVCVPQSMQAAVSARKLGNGYDPHSGIELDRNRMSRIIQRMYETDDNQFIAEAANVILTNGATIGVNAVIAASKTSANDPAGVVLLSKPGYPPYESIVKLHGLTPEFYKVKAENDCFFTYESLLESIQSAGAQKVRLLIYNYPHNPCGSMPDKAQAQQMAMVLTRIHAEFPQIVFLEESLYLGTISGDFPLWCPYSVLNEEARDNTALVGSGSKIGLAGPRAGFIYSSDNKLAAMCANYVSLTIAGSGYIPHAGYMAMLEKLDLHQGQTVQSGNHPRMQISGFFQTRINLIAENLNKLCIELKIPGPLVEKIPKGGMYLWVDFAPLFQGKPVPLPLHDAVANGKTLETAQDLQLALMQMHKLQEEPVVLAPGETFGAEAKSMICRISCVSPEIKHLHSSIRTISVLARACNQS